MISIRRWSFGWIVPRWCVRMIVAQVGGVQGLKKKREPSMTGSQILSMGIFFRIVSVIYNVVDYASQEVRSYSTVVALED